MVNFSAAMSRFGAGGSHGSAALDESVLAITQITRSKLPIVSQCQVPMSTGDAPALGPVQSVLTFRKADIFLNIKHK
ncbi:hypothetical protein AVEN_12478-1 [Araneus ventricosus]|uniref:Uncharacterized protein n=1 Tax=Araneus ventricosus TaxID=182803 RepID=A0A4Y2XEK9_ARAVE|nr:hypothetical protein AVEN_12478-1 [Araneus ventricosus]